MTLADVMCKGISLSLDQYKAFLKALPEINASLGLSDVEKDEADEEDEEDEEVVDKKPAAKKSKKAKAKANIDATSDEEDDE